MTEREKKLSEVIDFYVTHSIIDIDGETMTLGDAIRELRGGNHTVAKWRKCSEQQPKTPRYALVYRLGNIEYAFYNGEFWCVDQGIALYKMQVKPTHWMTLPLPPVPEDET